MFLFYYFYPPFKIFLNLLTFLDSQINKNKNSINNKNWNNLTLIEQIANQEIGDQLQIIQKEYQKKKFLIETISDGICAIDNSEKIVFFNNNFFKKFLKPLGFSNPEQDNNMNISNVFIDYPEIKEAYLNVIKNKDTTSLRHIHHRHKERDLYFDITINPTIESELKSFASAVGIFHNVTDKHLSDLMRVNFVANISHEMRTPLTSLMGFTQLLQNDNQFLHGTNKTYIDKIYTSAKKMQIIFNDLLNLSVIESQYHTNKIDVEIKEFLESIIESIQAMHKEKKLLINFHLKVDSIFVDPTLFEQVLSNLIDNSCKYSNQNEIIIDFYAEKQNENIQLQLSDNGPGVPFEFLNRIFERFFRISKSRGKLRTEGTGIGLSIVKQIIARHKGKVWAENKDGKTFFCLLIPEKKLN